MTAATAQSVSKKYRRALRNATGTRFTDNELRLMADLGCLQVVMAAEERELRKAWQRTTPPTSSDDSGSISDPTDDPTSGKSPGMTPEAERRGTNLLVNQALNAPRLKSRPMPSDHDSL